jgi:ABC-type nitrate/sulfonate/bicarbonate transport system substrate-binding protein
MAFDLLTAQGYTITPTFYSSGDVAVAALERGDADISNGATRNHWTAVKKGARIVTIMEQVANEWSVLSKKEMTRCEDLNGKRFGTNPSAGVARVMTLEHIRVHCPSAKLIEVTVPSSENRAAAMIAGQLDAATLELVDTTRILYEAPDRFRILINFAQSLPKLDATGIYANRDYAAKNPGAIRDYIRALLTVHRRIKEQPQLLETEAIKRIGLRADLAPLIIREYLAINAFDVNGGMDEESLRYSIAFLANASAFEAGLKSSDVADLSYLNAVLDEIGRK